MFEISHYSSLDEILEAGPPVESLCSRCRSLKLSELFSGPRYEDFEQGHEEAYLDVFIGTVAEFDRLAEECRFCYVVTAFHAAQHSKAFGSDCTGGSERCILKPFRTDAALHMMDQSTDSDKGSISTSIMLLFEDPVHALRMIQVRAERSRRRTSKDGSLSSLIFRAKSVLSNGVQQNDTGVTNNRFKHEAIDNDLDPSQENSDSCDSISLADRRGQDSCTSVMGLTETDLQPVELPDNAYHYHNCLFCLSDTSSGFPRRTLRYSKTAQGPKIDWPSLRGWIEACERDHPACRPKRAEQLVADAEFRVYCIDVRSSTIVPITPQTRYLALSYVWGTAHGELADHVNHCIIGNNSTLMIESLPSTIRDAIRVTERLGERYLWVDSICLDQSSAAVIAEQIGFMDRIYENAALTIVASTSRDVYSEIPGIRAQSRLRSTTDLCIGGQSIVAVFAPNYNVEFQGHWRYRGWTFQEWVLSKRCLMFSNNQSMFRCQEFSGLESFQPPRSTSSSRKTAIPKFWTDTQCAVTILPGFSLDSSTWDFQSYAYHVSEYTARHLTYSSDILHAFTGIMRKLERSNGMTFIEGLPREDLLRALLWSTTASSPKYRRTDLPSWSWVSSTLPATYICWELDEWSVENLSTQRYEHFLAKITDAIAFKSAKKSKSPIIVSASRSYERSVGSPTLYRGFRLRSARVALSPVASSLYKSCLQVISETRSVLIHQNAPRKKQISLFSKDDLLHPLSKNVIAGRNYDEDAPMDHNLVGFNLAISDSLEPSFSSHDAVLMYEWEIIGEQGKRHREVVAMIIDRLGDGKVKRVTLVSLRSNDWRTLPLINESEELTLV